jgi:hypothetical protein
MLLYEFISGLAPLVSSNNLFGAGEVLLKFYYFPCTSAIIDFSNPAVGPPIKK